MVRHGKTGANERTHGKCQQSSWCTKITETVNENKSYHFSSIVNKQLWKQQAAYYDEAAADSRRLRRQKPDH